MRTDLISNASLVIGAWAEPMQKTSFRAAFIRIWKEVSVFIKKHRSKADFAPVWCSGAIQIRTTFLVDHILQIGKCDGFRAFFVING